MKERSYVAICACSSRNRSNLAESRLLQILREASPARKVIESAQRDMGIADKEPFPFLALIGQEEMKLALILAVINPQIGGVLLIGARGTGKTTAVRSLIDLLPNMLVSLCPNNMGCNETLIETDGMTAVCQECAQRFAYGDPLSRAERMRLIELPLNARLEDVVGGINERKALEKREVQLEKGILGQADQNLLYIDEVNLLEDAVLDAILDATAQGYYTVRRGPNNLTYRSRFSLIGSMNPEEGKLRPQIMDRFGLRVIVRGLPDPEERFEAYQLALWHKQNAEELSATYAEHTLALAEEIETARKMLPAVTITIAARNMGLKLVSRSGIESNRAEITLFEAARAYAAADARTEVLEEDVQAVALLALRQRQSRQLTTFFDEQAHEDRKINQLIEAVIDEGGDAHERSNSSE